MRARRHGDGELRGPGTRHRPDARVRRIHRGRAADFDPGVRRRSREDGGGRADRRGHGRRHRGRQHGMPGAEDREAQRRLQPDARAGACRRCHRGDDEGREDSGDGQDAGRVERGRAQRAGAGADGGGRRGVGGRRARPDRGAELHRIGRLGSRRAHCRRVDDPGVRQRRLRRARAGDEPDAVGRRGRARRTRRAAQSLDSRAGRGPRRGTADARRSRSPIAGSFCSTTSIC